MPQKRILVLVCPETDCDNYFGSTSMPELILDGMNSGRGINGEKIGEPYPRSQCPACKDRGRETMRVLLELKVELPEVIDSPVVNPAVGF